MNTQLVYDATFDGWLTAVFDIYERKLQEVSMYKSACVGTCSLFGERIIIHTDEQKAIRVWTGLKKRLSAEARDQLFRVWLSELPDVEQYMLAYVRYALDNTKNIEQDFSHPAVVKLSQINKMVSREKHRMEAFVRFQLTRDGIYYAIAEPDFNVLPLIKTHFEKRYADQRWLIYDARRTYGIYYDLQQVSTISISFDSSVSSTSCAAIYDEQEDLYQQLWQQYFKSTTIASRKNPKLHIQHMPLRYWKYLTEKKQAY